MGFIYHGISGADYHGGILDPISAIMIAAMTGWLRDISLRLENELARSQKVDKERENLIEDLREALAEVKTLRGLIPICSYCKKIRDDKGIWQQIEKYIHEHSHARFTHGICPECMQKLYPDLFEKSGEEKE